MERSSIATLLWHQAFVALVAGLISFVNLGGADLFDEDEPKNAVCGREMFLRGDWIVPTFNGGLRTDKPILVYWLMLTSYSVFGVSEFAARFGSAVMGMGTSLATYHLGRKLFQPQAGLWGALVQATCLLPAVIGRMATPDSTFIFCITASLLSFVWATSSRLQGSCGIATEANSRSWKDFVPATLLQSLPMYGCMGLAVLAKGPAGFLLPGMIVGLFLLVLQQKESRKSRQDSRPTGRWRRFLLEIAESMHPSRVWRAVVAMRLFSGAIVVAIVALPWYVSVGLKTDGEWLAGFLGTHNVGRFLRPMEGHWGPIIYYIPVVLIGFAPWSQFVPLVLWRAAKESRSDSAAGAGTMFLLVWACAWIGFFSISRTKLPNYIAPAFPPLAVLTGAFLSRWVRDPAGAGLREFRIPCGIQGAISVAALIAAPIALRFALPSESWMGLFAILSLIGARLAWFHAGSGQRLRALGSLGVTAVALTAMVVGICPARLARYQDGVVLGRMVRELSQGAARPVATVEYSVPNIVYYSGQHVEQLKREQVETYLASHPDAIVLARQKQFEEIRSSLFSDLTIFANCRRLLRDDEILILGRPLQTAITTTQSISN